MNRKASAFFSALVFLVSLDSCVPINKTARTDPDRLIGKAPFSVTVVAVQTKTGERLEFSKKDRATVSNGKVLVLDPGGSVPSRLTWTEIAHFKKDQDAQVKFVETKDGRAFLILSSKTAKDGVVINRGIAYRSIPLSDVELVWVRKTNWPVSIAIGAAATAVVAAGVILATADLSWDLGGGSDLGDFWGTSCPFVYSFDGEQYVLDAEPYGGSVCPGLERVDWVGLDNLKPVDGRYKLLLANELVEVEHVDELKLVLVDHPEGVAVVPELSGRMRTIASPRPPMSARDGDGRDVRPLLSSKDGTFWVGRVEGRDTEKDEDLKDELFLEFTRPAGAKNAKLVANTWWTQWGTEAIKPLLATQGRELARRFEEINAGGPARLAVMSWLAREEMYNLQVRVETDSGWKTKALIFGGGPMIAKDKAYFLDLSDVPGDTVRLKLTPAAGFWMIDRLALDFTEDAPVRVTELAAVSARDAAGRDISTELASDDGNYFVIPKGAGPAALEFAALAPAPGSARAFFVKAGGYYDLMLNGEGEPTLDFDKTLSSPGETIRLALRTHPAINRPSPRLH
jgi:hypothetical protein